MAYVARTEDFDCGIMISASHNPFYDNGIKLINAAGEKMKEDVVVADGVADSLVGRSVCITLLDLLHHGVADASFHFLRLCRIRKSTENKN